MAIAHTTIHAARKSNPSIVSPFAAITKGSNRVTHAMTTPRILPAVFRLIPAPQALQDTVCFRLPHCRSVYAPAREGCLFRRIVGIVWRYSLCSCPTGKPAGNVSLTNFRHGTGSRALAPNVLSLPVKCQPRRALFVSHGYASLSNVAAIVSSKSARLYACVMLTLARRS